MQYHLHVLNNKWSDLISKKLGLCKIYIKTECYENANHIEPFFIYYRTLHHLKNQIRCFGIVRCNMSQKAGL